MAKFLINKSNNRFYYLQIAENLFGEVELIVAKGSHNKKSIINYYLFESQDVAIIKLNKLIQLRFKHGYVLMIRK